MLTNFVLLMLILHHTVRLQPKRKQGNITGLQMLQSEHTDYKLFKFVIHTTARSLGGQVVRRRSRKPKIQGSIPCRGSLFSFCQLFFASANNFLALSRICLVNLTKTKTKTKQSNNNNKTAPISPSY